ncbi:MAG: hypothetical protein WCF98_08885 [Synechococcus sp. ELA057]|jgi:hypothetical protein
MDIAQVSANLGDSVPLVFCLQDAGYGGVMVSPAAAEARFENSATNQVTAYYLLIVSEGQLDSIPVRDVFSGPCRHGTHTQTYNRRAGTWIPENVIVQRSGYTLPDCPQTCGSIGSYPDITTVSVSRQVADLSTLWDRQVWLFIRGGIYVTRLLTNNNGSSNNFADFCNYLLSNIGRLAASQIDTDNLTKTARFLSVNGLACDFILKNAINYEELIAKWAPYFLVRPSRVNGKRGLKPLVPVNANGTINTSSSVAVYQFDEDTILPDSFRIDYSDLSNRQPFVAQVMWRQQAEDDIGIVRTVEVRYSDTNAGTIPLETHDLSEFCTRGQHAVMVGAYILASRVNTTHSITFQARPQSHNLNVQLGDIVRVKLQRKTVGLLEAVHDYLYEVISKSKSLDGVVSYECLHHPVDTQGRSIVAMAVSSVVYAGGLVSTAKTGPSCDADSSRATNASIPAETYIQVVDPPTPLTTEQAAAVVPSVAVLIGNLPVHGTATGAVTNADDGLDSQA